MQGAGAEPPVQGADDHPPRARLRMAEGGSGDTGSPGSLRPGLPGARGLLGRRPTAPPLTPGRLPSIRSRDLTLGGVKKVSTPRWGGELPKPSPLGGTPRPCPTARAAGAWGPPEHRRAARSGQHRAVSGGELVRVPSRLPQRRWGRFGFWFLLSPPARASTCPSALACRKPSPPTSSAGRSRKSKWPRKRFPGLRGRVFQWVPAPQEGNPPPEG